MSDSLIRVLGPLDVVVAGRPVAVGGPRQRTVLGLLVVHAREVVSADRLQDELWGEAAPPTAPGTLHVYISRLRKLLGPLGTALRTHGHGYVLDVAPDQVDAGRLEQLAAAAWQAMSAADFAQAVGLLEQAQRLWRGPAYADLADAAFTEPETVRLEELRLALAESRIDCRLSLGEHAQLVAELQDAVRRYPLREQLWERLMLALYRSGRQADALAAYARCRDALADGVGVDPGPALRRLHDAVLHQRAELAAAPVPGSTPGAASPYRRVMDLPPRNPAFTGRDEVLAGIRAGLVRATTTSGVATPMAVALHGLGGSGKTQLALEYAHRRAAALDLVWWVPADDRLAMSGALEALAARLGVAAGADQSETRTLLWDHLRERSGWLLVYDNAEQPADLAPMLPPAGAGEIVVTSRNPAWGRVARPLPVPVFTRAESAAFLLRRTAPMKATDAAAVAELLGDLPLALEQASAYMEQTGMAAEAYRRLFTATYGELMSRGRPSGYDGTLDTTWQLAFDRVSRSDDAARLLHLCAVLAPDAIPFGLLSLPVADPSLPEVRLEDAVAELLRYSLVERDQQGLRMHRLVQAVVRGRMSAPERARWITLVSRLLAADAPESPETPAEWPRWATLAPHVLVLAMHAEADAAVSAELLDLLRTTARYLITRASFADARRLLDVALRLAQASPVVDAVTVAELVTDLGELLDRVGSLQESLARLQEALGILEGALGPHDRRVGVALARLGHAYNCAGEIAAAVAVHERALSIMAAPRTGDPLWAARVHTDLGYVLWAAGQLDRSAEHFVASMRGYEAAVGPTHPEAANALSGLGMVAQDAGDLDAARAHQERALELFQAAYGPEHPDVAQSLDKLGYVARLAGDIPAAVDYHQRAVASLAAIFGPTDSRVGMALTNLGLAVLAAEDAAGAVDAQQQARAIFRHTYGDVHPHTLLATRRLAVARAALDDCAAARVLLDGVPERTAELLGADHPDVGRAHLDVATVLAADGDAEGAARERARAAELLLAAYGPDHPEVLAVPAVRRPERIPGLTGSSA